MGEIMENIFIRSEMLYGENSTAILKNSKVAVFGIGGVGSYVCEALARCGVGNLTLIDNDTVSFSNINRQLVALHSTVGKYKTDVMAERINAAGGCAEFILYEDLGHNVWARIYGDEKTYKWLITNKKAKPIKA